MIQPEAPGFSGPRYGSIELLRVNLLIPFHETIPLAKNNDVESR
jgi:hypothetical protein